ncbi:hypothetical protein F511_03501 [Dorcoceras hygrometricum]|uniref:Uncharacterized protein n=1 Tax=Dorcoceras hygrometricum TaxID=472368 RepID=A0A2Z7AQM4_9LAMI|nr:hypothetical protein F511_03501 [Dorcoceras hygrometricum]
MGPKSNIGPKTSRGARDRPEKNLEAKFSRRNDIGDSSDGCRTAAAAGNTLRGSRANKRMSSRAQRPSIAQHLAHGRARNNAIKRATVSVRESRIQYLCDPQWFRDTASRGPRTIAAPESQFRICPSDHDNIDIHACLRAVNPRQRCIDSYMHRGSGRTIKLNRDAINTKNNSTFYDIHRMFSELPLWHLCLAPTGVSRTRLFSVDCGRYANPAGTNSGEVWRRRTAAAAAAGEEKRGAARVCLGL